MYVTLLYTINSVLNIAMFNELRLIILAICKIFSKNETDV